jgi:hypothetical protein
MEWEAPKFSAIELNAAGRMLISGKQPWTDEYQHTLEVINNWRNSHNFPLNTFKVTLRYKTSKVDRVGLTAQRIKRLWSIDLKLRNQPTMRLVQMQDIGGCRAVVSSVTKVRQLQRLYRHYSSHALHDIDDYIEKPRATGYRGVHLIYRYFSEKNTAWNGLKIEIQLRSALQHAWATAVETVGTFIGQALKSSLGEKDWLRFFALTATYLARREKQPPVPNTPTNDSELSKEIAHHFKKLDVEAHLIGYTKALQDIQTGNIKNARYYLLELRAAQMSVNITGYKREELVKASADYARVDRLSDDRSDAVLVSVDSIAALRQAYPNYFLDTHVFLQTVRDAISGKP